jgi:hypothetical protein
LRQGKKCQQYADRGGDYIASLRHHNKNQGHSRRSEEVAQVRRGSEITVSFKRVLCGTGFEPRVYMVGGRGPGTIPRHIMQGGRGISKFTRTYMWLDCYGGTRGMCKVHSQW